MKKTITLSISMLLIFMLCLTSCNTVDAEGMVEVNLVSSGGDWFTLRSYSDGTVLISSPKNGDSFKPYRSGWGFGRNGQQLFRDLLEVFGD